MSRLKPYLIGVALGAASMYFSLQYHVVHSQEGWFLVPRTPQHNLGMAYADIRRWDEAKWQEHPELARALIANGSRDLISSSVAASANAPEKDGFSVESLRSTIGAGSSVSGTESDALLEPFSDQFGRPGGQSVFESDDHATGVFEEQFPASESTGSRRSARSASAELPPLPEGRERTSAPLRGYGDSAARNDENPNENIDADRNLIDSLFDSAHHDSSGLDDSSPQGFPETSGRVANRFESPANRPRRELAEPLDQIAESFNRGVDSQWDGAGAAIGNPVEDGQLGSANRSGQYIRDAVGDFRERTSDTGFADDAELSPELRALRDRFDPFAN